MMQPVSAQLADDRVPISLLTGFLGSGKTTVLSRFLRHPGMAHTVVIMNEFGEIGLDHELLQAPEEEVVLLNNGCLCCAVLGDLITTLRTLNRRRRTGELPPFERIVIETSGLADPAPVLHTLITDPEATLWCRLDTIVAVVDAVNAPTQLEAHFESAKQIAVADRILLSKTDLRTANDVEQLVARLRRLNPSARLRQAVRGEIGPEILFRGGSPAEEEGGVGLQAWLDAARRDETARGHEAERGRSPLEPHHHDSTDHHHLHESEIRTFSFWLDEPLHPVGLQMWLDQIAVLRGPNLLRVKGILNVEGRPTVVHAVQHLFHAPEELDRWPSDDRRSRIVFITHKLERADIEASLALLTFRPQTLQLSPGKIGAATFAEFSAAMKRMYRIDAS
jgi:G3E family GTPase